MKSNAFEKWARFFSEKLSYFLAHIIKSKTNKNLKKVALVESWSSQPGERDEARIINKNVKKIINMMRLKLA